LHVSTCEKENRKGDLRRAKKKKENGDLRAFCVALVNQSLRVQKTGDVRTFCFLLLFCYFSTTTCQSILAGQR